MKMDIKEKQQAANLLAELESLGPEDLADWNRKAESFLVFMAAKIEVETGVSVEENLLALFKDA